MAIIRKKKPYEAQLNRVKRWKGRIDKIIEDCNNGTSSVDILELADNIYAFFTCCDHVKDYIDKDDSIEIEESPYDFLNRTECLKKCRDICVGTKHLKIKDPKTDDGPFMVNVVKNNDDETGDMFFEVNIKSNSVKENFSKLADECISAWEDYIEKEITSKPKNQIKIKCPNCKKDFMCDDDLIMCVCPLCGQDKILTGVK